MAKTKISEFNANPALNTDIDSINISEGCAPSGINDAIRELMSQLKDWQSGTSNDPYVVGSSGSLTLNQGTANGVAYLNGSKVVTSGSALTFDGTNLGIGTSSPSTRLELGGDATPILRMTSTSGPYAQVTANTAGTLQLMADEGNTGASTSMRFRVDGAEAMRIDSSGNVGIGTSSPNTNLEVSTSIDPVLRLNNSTTAVTNGADIGEIQFYTNDASTSGTGVKAFVKTVAGAFGSAQGGANLVFGTAADGAGNASEKMRIDLNGNLGIGTSSPAYKLDVNGGARITTSAGYNLVHQTASSRFRLNFLNDDGSSNIDAMLRATSFYFQNGSGSTVLNLDSSGNLGLGVTPSAWASTRRAFQLSTSVALWSSTSAASLASLGANVFDNGSEIYINTGAATKYVQNNGTHAWHTAASGTAGNAITFTQAMTMTAAGTLLIGRTADVSNTTRLGLDATASIAGFVSETGPTTSVTHGRFNNGNGTVGSISTNGTATTYATSSDYRLKNISGSITTSGAYIDSLNPVEGTWKADGSTFVGLIAHEVQESSRTTVATGVKDGEEMQGMDYSSAEIIANLIAEIQSLRKRLADAGL